MAVGVAKINRVRDFVILEFEFDSVLLEFALCTEKILPVRAKREMKHSNLALRRRLRLLVGRKQGEPRIAFANEIAVPLGLSNFWVWWISSIETL